MKKQRKKEYGYYWSPAHPPKQTILQIVKWAWVQLVLDHIKENCTNTTNVKNKIKSKPAYLKLSA